MTSPPSNSDRWARLEELFHEASALEPAEVSAFLDRACAGDAALRKEVEQLLDHQATDLPDLSAESAAALEAAFPVEPPEQIGAYRIERELGRGGMGVVYLGQRTRDDFEHKAAIKILPGAAYDPKALRRFKNERRILATLQHPGIARLLDGGATDSGVPYVVMDYVDGVPIDVYCTREDLGIPERLKLFIKVCEAVSYAHRQLVIHRDLKPSNIIIDADGTPKLLDFGIAKLVDPEDRDHATTITRIMTLAYASPEQVEGRAVGTATDIHALGGLLYMLLTGERPFGGADTSRAELAHRIVNEAPQPPSRATGDARLAGDLDAIVLKALEREPQHRYATVDAFAQDIQAHLESRPVLARPFTWAYRAEKFVQRNRAISVVGALAVLALTLGAAGLATGFLRARAAERVAVQEARVAQEITDYMVGLFEVAGADSALGRDLSAVQLLDHGAARIATSLDAPPAVRVRLQEAMAEGYMGLGQMNEARELLEAALEDAEGDDARYAALLSHLGVTYRYASRLDEAETALEQARSMIAPFVDTTSTESLAETPAESQVLARTFIEGALVAGAGSRLDDAAPLAETGLRLQLRIDSTAADRVAQAYATMATVHFYAGDPEQAAPFIERAVEVLDGRLEADDPTWLHYQTLLATAYAQTGRRDSAVVVFGRVLPVQEARAGSFHPNVVQTKLNYGSLLNTLGDPRARDMLEAALAGFERNDGPESMTLAPALVNLGILAEREGRRRDALAAYTRAMEIRITNLGRDNPRTANAMLGVAKMHADLGDYAEAVEYFATGIRALRPVGRIPAAALDDYAAVLRRQGLIDVAEAAEAEARMIREARDSGDPGSNGS